MPELIRLKLLLSYDGSQFSGWAVQPGLRTVQGEIEHAVGKILRRENDVRLTVAGRTDAGVHARGQVAHLDVTPAELEKWTGKATRIEDSSAQSIARAQKLTGVLRRLRRTLSFGVRMRCRKISMRDSAHCGADMNIEFQWGSATHSYGK